MKHINKSKLSAFGDGEVSDKENSLISEHLKSCDYCRKELKRLSLVWDYLDSMEEIQGSPYFMANLKEKLVEEVITSKGVEKRVIRLPFLEWFTTTFTTEWIRRIAVPVGATALLAVSILLISYLGKDVKALQIGKEFDNLFNITLLDDLPENSLGDVYTCLLTEEILPQGGK